MSSFNCSSCNAPNASNARFCTNCGSSLMKASAAPYQTPSSQPEAALVSAYAFAGFWKRWLAYIIDGILFSSLFFLAIFLMTGSLFNYSSSGEKEVMAIFGLFIFYFPAWWLYFALMESSAFQGTLGKKIVGIKVTDINGQPINFGQATGRHFSSLLSGLSFDIGYLLAAFTARKQALHDMIANTLVVNKRYDSVQIRVASENPGSGMSVGGIIGIIFLVLLLPIGGIIAAVAIPAYQDYTIKTQVSEAIIDSQFVQNSITEHAADTGYWPTNFQQLGMTEQQLETEQYQLQLHTEGGYRLIFRKPKSIVDARIEFRAILIESGDYEWRCTSDDLKTTYLPINCR